MNRKLLNFGFLLAALLVLTGVAAAQDGPAKPEWTMAEHRAYTACTDDTVAASRVKCLDGFFAAFPNSKLAVYAYRVYYTSYGELKQSRKVTEYTDKMLALGSEKVDASTRLEAAYVGTTNFYAGYLPNISDKEAYLTAGRTRAKTGLEIVAALKKPENLTEDQFAAQMKQLRAIFYHAVGFTSLELKDYREAIEGFKSALEHNPADGLAWYRKGVAHLQNTPPEHLDGFWAVAKSISLKGPGEAQVRRYLRNQMLAYQQPTCEASIDAQMNELLALAGGAAERPAGYSIPNAAELEKARAEVGTFIADLKGGGDKAKITWLALCSSEFPELFGKVFEVSETAGTVTIKAFLGASQEEIEASTAPNSELKVSEQPEAARLVQKAGTNEGIFRFAGTLAGYEPEPFLLKWDKVKVNAEDIPEAKPEPKAPKKAPAKRPAKKRPPTR